MINQEAAGKTFANLSVSVVRIMFRHRLLWRYDTRDTVAGCCKRGGDLEERFWKLKEFGVAASSKKPEVWLRRAPVLALSATKLWVAWSSSRSPPVPASSINPTERLPAADYAPSYIPPLDSVKQPTWRTDTPSPSPLSPPGKHCAIDYARHVC